MGQIIPQELELEDPTYNGLRTIPELSTGQKKIMKALDEEIGKLHKEIERRLVFLSTEKKLVNGKYVQVSFAREQFEFPSPSRHIVNHSFILAVTAGGDTYTLNEVELWTRKARMTKYMEQPYTWIMQIQNQVNSPEFANFNVIYKKITPAGEQTKVYPLQKIEDPNQRIRIARVYRAKLYEILSSIDRYVNAKGKGMVDDIRFVKEEMNTTGQYQEF
jgi:hypothetical protein